MKWIGLLVAIAVWWGSVCVANELPGRGIGRLWSRITLYAMLLFALGIAVGSPQIIMNPAPYVREALGQYGAGQTGGFEIWQVDALSGWLFYGKTLIYGMGAVLVILGVVGGVRRLALIANGGDQTSVLLLPFPVTYYLLMGTTRHYFARYALPLVPFMALFAAESVQALWVWFGERRRRLGRALATALVAAAILQPLAWSVQHGLLLAREDTRTVAKLWC